MTDIPKTIKLTKADRRNIELAQAFTGIVGPIEGAERDTASLISERLKNAMEQRWHEAAQWLGRQALRDLGLNHVDDEAARLILGCKKLTEQTGVYMRLAGQDGVTGRWFVSFNEPPVADLDNEIPF